PDGHSGSLRDRIADYGRDRRLLVERRFAIVNQPGFVVDSVYAIGWDAQLRWGFRGSSSC
ncbi:hypothetical protein, partial [Rhizorhabdus argentea]|uniref:hypothetical protein n=1 Tax=Rhizorhabdus argentea TaxID=1387174 RepID=UPI0030EC6CD1